MLAVSGQPQDLEGIRAEYGLNAPLPVQYLNYVARAVHGDLGISIRTRDPVARTLFTRLQLTLQLTVLSMLLSVSLGVLAGVVAATHHNTWVDTSIMVTALTGISIPGLLAGPAAADGLCRRCCTGYPAGGSGTPLHLVLPAIVLGASARRSSPA